MDILLSLSGGCNVSFATCTYITVRLPRYKVFVCYIQAIICSFLLDCNSRLLALCICRVSLFSWLLGLQYLVTAFLGGAL